MQWYYVVDGKQYGPVEESDIRKLIGEGNVRPSDLVWNQTMGDKWSAVSEIPSLVSGAVSAPAGAPAVHSGLRHNRDLIREARECLSGLWSVAVGAALVYNLILMAVGFAPYTAGIVQWIIAGPMATGLAILILALARREEARIAQLFEGFKRFGTTLGAYLLMNLFILLWSLLLIIPGIIASYAYAMTFYVIADDPSVGALTAIRRSKEMMRGRKWKLF